LLRLVPFLVGILAIGAVLYASRDLALHRLVQGEEVEQRSAFLPVYATMAKDYFPTGAGFGSFATIFQVYEPQESMTVEYMNQAHNDWVQLVIEGGLPALALALAFILWFIQRSFAAWRRMPRSPAELMARTGSATALLILFASAVDYPLRTPFMAVVMALFCCWMLPARSMSVTQGKSL
jgi:O-antigen ligase